MSDRQLRELEREAATGDVRAQLRLRTFEEQHGLRKRIPVHYVPKQFHSLLSNGEFPVDHVYSSSTHLRVYSPCQARLGPRLYRKPLGHTAVPELVSCKNCLSWMKGRREKGRVHYGIFEGLCGRAACREDFHELSDNPQKVTCGSCCNAIRRNQQRRQVLRRIGPRGSLRE